MNLDFSEDQKFIKSEANRLLREVSSTENRRKILDSDEPYDKALWQQFAELGWLGVTVDEQYGGLGLGYIEQAVIAEEIGYFLSAAPYSSSVYGATEAIKLAGSEAQREQYLPKLVDGSTIGTLALVERKAFPTSDNLETTISNGRISGTKVPVTDGIAADFAVVLAKGESGDLCFAIVQKDAPGVTVETLESLDSLRPETIWHLDQAECDVLTASQGQEALDKLLGIYAVLLAFEQIGGSKGCLDMAVLYAKERKTFGRIIGSYQGVKHKLADIFADIELTSSNAYYSIWALESGSADIDIAAPAARLSAISMYESAAKESMQIHGGMGFTWEMDCHLYLKRARSLAVQAGSARIWKKRLINAVDTRRKNGTLNELQIGLF